MDSPSEKAVIAVRSRPLFEREIVRNCTSVLKFPTEDENIVILGRNGFEFDRIFSGSRQEEIFEMVKPLLSQVWAGYSATVMAYGQTGAGKTYTMGTGRGRFDLDSEGVVPRTVRELFELNSDDSAKIFVSFVEVYNEGVYDLLSATPTRKMQARAFRDLGIQEVTVGSVDEALKKLDEGIEARRVSETQGNEKSSRSHAIFSLHIHRSNEFDNMETRSLIHLVDLAGSEAVGKAGNQGSLKLEGISINQGLLALSNCIRAVIQKNQHIPVRNTALTNVMQDALKGQCLLALIACVSPSSRDETETAQTLRFAQAFHKIKSKPHIQKIVAQHAAKVAEAAKKVLVTPSGPRKPFSLIGNNAAFQPINLHNRVSNNYQFITRRTQGSPTEFDNSLGSGKGNNSMVSNMSSASIFSHFSEHELNEFMSNVLVEKIEKLKKETEELVNKKIEDALKGMGSSKTNEILSQPDSQSETEDFLNATVVDVGIGTKFGSSTPNSCRRLTTAVQSCQTSPAVGILIDLDPELPREEPPMKKLRRSVRLSCIDLPDFLRSQPAEDEELDAKAKRKLRRSVRLSSMDLPAFLRTRDEDEEPAPKQRRRSCMPKLDDFSTEEKKPIRPVCQIGTEPRKIRRSLRLSCLNLPKIEDLLSAEAPVEVPEEQNLPEENVKEPKERTRRSIGPEILEEKLFRESPSTGTAQEKHNRRMLVLLNTECTKVLQQLPTVGPKTGYVIYSYRQIHGHFTSFDDLKSVPGLSANFLKRFFKANNIKFLATN